MMFLVEKDLNRKLADLNHRFELMLKGYPEFNQDQPRDEGGRWAGGGGVAGSRRTRSTKPGGKQPGTLSKPARSRRKKIKDDVAGAKKAVEDMYAARNKADAEAAAKRYNDAIRDTYDRVYDTPQKVWAEPTFTDAVFEALTDLWVVTGVLIASVGSHWPTTIYGMTVATIGLYRMIRHVYRKMTIPGYQGVRKPWDEI